MTKSMIPKTPEIPQVMKDMMAMAKPLHDLVAREGAALPVMNIPGRPPFMLDRDVAKVYGVETMRLNQACKRNPKKFIRSKDYFRLSKSETKKCAKNVNITNCDIENGGGHRPFAYTKKGCYMFATILQTEAAVEQAVRIVEGFMRFEQTCTEPPLPAKDPLQALWSRAEGVRQGLALSTRLNRLGFDYETTAKLCFFRQNFATQKEAAAILDFSRDKVKAVEGILKEVGIVFKYIPGNKRNKMAIDYFNTMLFEA